MKSQPRIKIIVVKYRSQAAEVAVTFAETKRLSISVHPDLRVTARAPVSRPILAVAARIQARAVWIFRQLGAFHRLRPLSTPRRYVSGETHLYLGRQYRLKLKRGPDEKVVLTRGFLNVTVFDPKNTSRIETLLNKWYRHRAEVVLTERYYACHLKMKALKVPESRLRFRRMRLRWGSCTKAGTILLNPELIKVPTRCAEYVIAHEICHLKVMKHDRSFYELLERYLPDWRATKDRLDRPDFSVERTP